MFDGESGQSDTSHGLNSLGVAEILKGIRLGRFSSDDVVRDCLARIGERDHEVGAWVEVPTWESVQRSRLSSSLCGPLVGLPFAVKDVIDTASFKTEMGSKLYSGHRPRFDASCVAQMQLAGAIVLGKTTTCEFAGVQPTVTANPLDLARSPGGSSSGSAAAVADLMVPFAFGTQTGGSVLRPASFCGVVGFKPTYGFYSIAGMKPAAHAFDTIGLIARSVADVALLHGVLMNMPVAESTRRQVPRIGVFRSHLWNTLEPGTEEAFEATLASLETAGAQLTEVAPPPGFETITQSRAIINAFERARGLAAEWSSGREQLGPMTAAICEQGFAVSGAHYVQACREVEQFRSKATSLFDTVDLLLTPTTAGEAPIGRDRTGDPRLQELWTMLHLPAVCLPSGRGKSDMPLGVQLVGARFEDSALLANAAWVESALALH